MQINKTRSGPINSVAIDSGVGRLAVIRASSLELNHFPERFAGMEPTTHLTEQALANVCPNCMRRMKFIKSIRLGPSKHELRVFLCPHCGEVESKEVKQAA